MALKFAAALLGVVGLALVAYGAFGTYVVFGDWVSCGSVANASFASLVDCRTMPWQRQFGIGIGLIVAGTLSIVVGLICLRRARRRVTLRDAD